MQDQNNASEAAQYAALEAELSQPDDVADAIHPGPPAETESLQGEIEGAVEGATLRQQREGFADAGQHQPQGREVAEPERSDGMPDILGDPVGHFNARFQAMEQHAGQTEFWNRVNMHEQVFRRDQPDYDDACVHLEKSRMAELAERYPNNKRTQALASQAGFASVRDMHEAILNKDRVTVARTALAHGRSPAAYYYQLAVERGHTPPPGPTRREADALVNLYETDPQKFDAAWEKMVAAGRL